MLQKVLFLIQKNFIQGDSRAVITVDNLHINSSIVIGTPLHGCTDLVSGYLYPHKALCDSFLFIFLFHWFNSIFCLGFFFFFCFAIVVILSYFGIILWWLHCFVSLMSLFTSFLLSLHSELCLFYLQCWDLLHKHTAQTHTCAHL